MGRIPRPCLGAVVDGCPSGLSLCENDIQKYLDRRRPGQGKFTTARREKDTAEILSGVFEGRTTGTPISIIIRNNDQISRDYDTLKNCFRPGHADFTFDQNTVSATTEAEGAPPDVKLSEEWPPVQLPAVFSKAWASA